jgi:hypothetical protein
VDEETGVTSLEEGTGSDLQRLALLLSEALQIADASDMLVASYVSMALAMLDDERRLINPALVAHATPLQ